ncbi:MAG: DUF481 domain-containing protein [Cyanobacteriota bacterium]|nr:DUF481 domain-containing protein [Cyanobacteriota bacterium]
MNAKICKIGNLALGAVLANVCLSEPVVAEVLEEGTLLSPKTRTEQLESNKNPDFPIAQNNFNRGFGSPTAEILLEALEVANTIEDAEIKAGILSEIAINYAQIGEPAIALDILSEALEIANTVEDAEAKATVLNAIAINYAALDNYPVAEEILSLALEEVSSLEDSEKKASLLTEIALNYARIGDNRTSSEVLSESKEVVTAALAPPVYFPLEATPWQGSLSLGLNLTSDRNTTSVTTLIAKLERIWPRNELYTEFGFTNNFDSSRESDDRTRFSGDLTANYKHHFSERWQYFFNSFVTRDDANDVDFRSSWATGIGRNLWRGGPDRSLDMQLGVGIGFESSERETQEIDFPLIQYGLLYKDIFFSSLEFRQSFTFELPLNNTEDYFMQSTTTISVPLSQRWALDNSLIFEYFAIPVGDNPNLEMQLRTGLQYNF